MTWKIIDPAKSAVRHTLLILTTSHHILIVGVLVSISKLYKLFSPLIHSP